MTKPANLIPNAFLDNLGTDYVAVADNGQVVGRAGSEAAIRHAVPDAAHYLTGTDLAPPTPEKVVEDEPAAPEPSGAEAFDADGDGRMGGSKAGEESTAHKGAVKRAAKKA